LLVAAGVLAGNSLAQGLSQVKAVIVLGVDGLEANALRSRMPSHFQSFQREGAYSLSARGVMPTITFPNFASMLSGAGPEQHGVTSNRWRPDHFDIAPSCTGRGGIFPTIFGVLREERPSAKLAMFFDGEGFPFIVEPGVPDKIAAAEGSDKTLALALDYIASERPSLVFLHLDLMDHAGHTEGFDSPAYAQALTHSNELLGALMEKLRASGMLESTIVILTSDHGGVGKNHGGTSMTELEIPWMIRGPGVLAGKEIQAPINTFDTASTIAYIFGLKQPACWIGKPVTDAFAGTPAAAVKPGNARH
jgi:predicted AlkP superfamily pyrophosphatase or phosphodiesterase